MQRIVTFFSNPFVLGGIFLARLGVVLTTWILARTSYVPFILGYAFVFSLSLGIFGIVFKFLINVLVELTALFRLEETNIFQDEETRLHFSIFALIMLISEILLLLTLHKELREPTHLSIILAIISTGSLLSLLLQPSQYLTFWLSILVYVIAMFTAIIPRTKNNNTRERISLVLFLRSLFLPV